MLYAIGYAISLSLLFWVAGGEFTERSVGLGFFAVALWDGSLMLLKKNKVFSFTNDNVFELVISILLGFGMITLYFWLGGYDFNERNSTAIWYVVILILVGWGAWLNYIDTLKQKADQRKLDNFGLKRTK